MTLCDHVIHPWRHSVPCFLHRFCCLWYTQHIPAFICTDLPAKTRHHSVIHAIQFIRDLGITVTDIRKQSVVKMTVKFTCLITTLTQGLNALFKIFKLFSCFH